MISSGLLTIHVVCLRRIHSAFTAMFGRPSLPCLQVFSNTDRESFSCLPLNMKLDSFCSILFLYLFGRKRTWATYYSLLNAKVLK